MYEERGGIILKKTRLIIVKRTLSFLSLSLIFCLYFSPCTVVGAQNTEATAEISEEQSETSKQTSEEASEDKTSEETQTATTTKSTRQVRVVNTEAANLHLTVISNSNLREAATVTSRSKATIPAKTEMDTDAIITNSVGEIWYHVFYDDLSGYVSDKVVLVKEIEAPEPEPESEQTSDMADPLQDESLNDIIASKETVNLKLSVTSNTNLKYEPQSDSKIKMIIPFGLSLNTNTKITNTDGEEWYLVSYGSFTGYVLSSDVRATEALSERAEASDDTAIEAPEAIAASEESDLENEPAESVEDVQPIETAKVNDQTSKDSDVIDIDIYAGSDTEAPARDGVLDLQFFQFSGAVVFVSLLIVIVYLRIKSLYAVSKKLLLKRYNNNKWQ